jgi:tetratricopeptide (TPR) repeat protein
MADSYGQLGGLALEHGDYDAAEPLYRRSLEISERIGDPRGVGTSNHNLGILAQMRGDYDAAEPLYRRSLEISERIGDQAGMAASYSALGNLIEAAGNLDEAAAYLVGALAIRLKIGIAKTGHLQALAGLRHRLGSDRFRAAALASGLDEESAGNLMEMLDQQEKTTGD